MHAICNVPNIKPVNIQMKLAELKNTFLKLYGNKQVRITLAAAGQRRSDAV